MVLIEYVLNCDNKIGPRLTHFTKEYLLLFDFTEAMFV